MKQKTSIHIEHDRSGFKEYLFQSFYAPNLKPSPLKSLEKCITEAHQQIDAAYDQFINSLLNGENFFLEAANPQEKDQLTKILAKIDQPEEPTKGNTENFAINFDDARFLDLLARRELFENRFENASAMFRWILLFLPAYSSAIVGAAISEQQLNHTQEAKDLFTIGLEMLPNDVYLNLYAADFFVTIQENDKAKEILTVLQDNLKKQGLEASEGYQKITTKLAGF